ncbi:MAG: restriction endonuclease subunit S [Deltaproteobacteria bacterium]|nr:restriction endonuclease subunit S [Deltaproteobacteria bacterium]
MKKLLPISIILIFWFAGIANAQSAKEAIEALKKLESRVQVGISYKDYGPALGETHYKVKHYLDSPESNKNPKLRNSIEKALNHYIYANNIWGYKFAGKGSDIIYREEPPLPHQYQYSTNSITNDLIKKGDERRKEAAKIFVDQIMKDYRKVKLSSYGGGGTFISITQVLSVIWNEASDEIKIASKLVNADEIKIENTESEIESPPRPSKSKTRKAQ